ncbi:hypothetical protein C0995_012266 [Termitomyces sp. Mi166|nr:hypothetical protein C0995_012266 [Termitomyces sp. Mi166\
MAFYLSCDQKAPFKIGIPISTASKAVPVTVKQELVDMLKLSLPLSCTLQARDAMTDTTNLDLLAQAGFTIDAASTSTTTPNPPVTSTSELSSTPTDTSKAIVGGVVGGLVGIGILTILSIIWFCRRRPPPLQRPPTPVPLPYDPNYVQPLDKTSRLAQIINEKEAAEQQRDQLQTEVESMHLHESTRDHSSGISDTPSGSEPAERLIEALRQRILELEAQQRDLEHQLLPPSYLDSTSVP